MVTSIGPVVQWFRWKKESEVARFGPVCQTRFPFGKHAVAPSIRHRRSICRSLLALELIRRKGKLTLGICGGLSGTIQGCKWSPNSHMASPPPLMRHRTLHPAARTAGKRGASLLITQDNVQASFLWRSVLETLFMVGCCHFGGRW